MIQVYFFIICIQIGFNLSLIYLAEKWEIIKFYELYRRKWMPKTCYFCLLFWLAYFQQILILSLIYPNETFNFRNELIQFIIEIIVSLAIAGYSYSILVKSNENN